MTKPKKPYWKMTADELAQATREFDSEHIGQTFHDMTTAEEKAWRAAVNKKTPERPIRNKVVKTVSLEIRVALLKRVDALAKKRRISRAHLVTECLEALLSARG